jgi:hypothetical protein
LLLDRPLTKKLHWQKRPQKEKPEKRLRHKNLLRRQYHQWKTLHPLKSQKKNSRFADINGSTDSIDF